MPITVGNLGDTLKRKYAASAAKTKAEMPADAGKDLWVKTILNQNKGKNFVKRIQNPGDSPVTNNADGSHSTHRMASANNDEGPVVFPTMVQLPGQNKLIRLDTKIAERYAAKTGEQIKFKTDDQAQMFGKNYKRGLGVK